MGVIEEGAEGEVERMKGEAKLRMATICSGIGAPEVASIGLGFTQSRTNFTKH